jgi:peptide/nickel transport system substrate-binding protein
MFGYNASIPVFTHDLTKAAAELQQTPYWTTGFSITLYYNAGNTVREQACLLLKLGLEQLPLRGSGPVSVTVRALNWPVYLAALRVKALPIYFMGWAADYADPDDYVVPILRTGQYFAGEMGYSNVSLDAMIDQAASELDAARRERLYYNLTYAVVVYDVPCLWTYQETTFDVLRAWVTGSYSNPMYGGYYYYALGKA